MDLGTVLIVGLLICFGFIILYFIIAKLIRNQSEQLKPSREILEFIGEVKKDLREANRRQDQMSQNVVTVLQRNTADLNARLDKASEVIGGVQKNIGEMNEIGRTMKDLQEYLRSPKLRGNIGEQVLNEVLQQLLPKDLFVIQYTFKTGEKVDAVIKVGQSLIPVDAKFPIENFRKMLKAEKEVDKEKLKKEFVRDVKKHIADISRKYILTDENTVDYAIMYIPSEAIYYEVINSETLFDYSKEQRILVVSPMSFYAYLKAILMSFQGQTIQKKAKEILTILSATRKDYEKVEESLSVLEKHFGNAYNQLQNVNKFFMRLGQKLATTKMLEGGDKK